LRDLFSVKKWYDYQMQWKPEKYGGIQTIRVPPNQVWTPDVKHRNIYFEIFFKKTLNI
jgi:hypothetical protein